MDELQLIIEATLRMIVNGERHPDYRRVTQLAEEYKILSTGTDCGKLLRKYVRENDADFEIKKELTVAVTPAVAASLKNPFNKVIRNDRVKKGLEVKSAKNLKKIQRMMKGFAGSPLVDDQGLDYWLKTTKFELSFSDPNAWVVVEWKAVGPAEIPQPYPFVISSKEALNFDITNEQINFLLCCQDITYQASADIKKPWKAGKKYIRYDKNYTLVFEQIDRKLIAEKPLELLSNQQLINGKGNETFLVSWYEPKIGFPPCFRIGYFPDLETDNRTFVTPWHNAYCYFKKLLTSVSELDLTMASHVYPQKLQYTPLCPGKDQKNKCKKGYLADGSVCDACKGTGYQVHRSANDIMYFPMPDDLQDGKQVFDLEKVIVYKAPPIDLVKLQIEYIDKLEYKAHEAVFNSQMFNRKTATQTATEIDVNMESIYDTLEAFTEKESQLYKAIVTVFGILVNEKPDDIKVIHVYPSDFKLKTKGMLLAELKTVNDADAPSFVRDSINLDIAEIVFAGDDLGLLKYKVRRRFSPFNGKSEDQITFLLSSDLVDIREKVLYANFEAIFTEIEAEVPNFYFLETYEAQWNILEVKIKEYIAAIAENKPKLTLPALIDTANPEDQPI